MTFSRLTSPSLDQRGRRHGAPTTCTRPRVRSESHASACGRSSDRTTSHRTTPAGASHLLPKARRELELEPEPRLRLLAAVEGRGNLAIATMLEVAFPVASTVVRANFHA